MKSDEQKIQEVEDRLDGSYYWDPPTHRRLELEKEVEELKNRIRELEEKLKEIR